VVITGKGPERDGYLARIAKMDMQRVAVVSAWFANEDYPKMLASSDLGVSLHQSSSQLDLPMKVLDMFGTGLPVLARWYPCLAAELVQEGITGRTFRSAKELHAGLVDLLDGAANAAKLMEMRRAVLSSIAKMGSWEDEWEQQGLPLFS
jgi:beta-1,4-mannosyltransferase